MPRRRALHVMGASLLAIMVPGVRPSMARAAPAAQPPTCGPNRNRCRGATTDGGVIEYYCCPAPAWKLQCGGKSNGYKCVNRCKESAKQFPCESLPDRLGWTNGVCCPRPFYKVCNPKGPECTTCEAMGLKPCGKSGRVCCDPDTQVCRSPNSSPRCVCKVGSTCEAKCCKKSETCQECVWEGNSLATFVNLRRKKCCKKGELCCGGECCEGKTCCGHTCCPSGQFCAASKRGFGLGPDVCCPRERLYKQDGKNACCPVGQIFIDTLGICQGSAP